MASSVNSSETVVIEPWTEAEKTPKPQSDSRQPNEESNAPGWERSEGSEPDDDSTADPGAELTAETASVYRKTLADDAVGAFFKEMARYPLLKADEEIEIGRASCRERV